MPVLRYLVEAQSVSTSLNQAVLSSLYETTLLRTLLRFFGPIETAVYERSI